IGGYRVYTTLDPLLQRVTTDAVVKGAAEVETREGYTFMKMAQAPRTSSDYLQALAVAIDPHTGDVKALVGGRDYARSSYNRATQALRQPGSSMKPFVYARAIMDSLPANVMVADTALHVVLPNGDVYSPGNSDNEFLGNITMREALVRSRNPVAVQLGL